MADFGRLAPMRTRRAAFVLAFLTAAPALSLVAEASHSPVPPSCFTSTDVDVALVIDRSGSMKQTDNNPTTRMQDAKAAANQFLGLLRPNDQSALISFSTDWTIDRSLSKTHSATVTAVNALAPAGYTSIWAGLRLATRELTNQIDPAHSNRAGRPAPVEQVLVLLTDGAQTDYYTGFEQTPPGSPNPIHEANVARAAGITVFVIALGTNADLLRWLPTMEAIADTPSHFFKAASGANLASIFAQISQRIRDSKAPSVDISKPAAGRVYASDALQPQPSPFGAEPAVRRFLRPQAVATDDCQVQSVTWTLDVFDPRKGTLLQTVPLPNLGSNHTAPYPTQVSCDALPAGRHRLRAEVVDFVAKRGSDEAWFWCVKPAVNATAIAAYARVTNPADATAESPGARLPAPSGGHARSVTVNYRRDTPLPIDLSLAYDEVSGSRILLPGGEPGPHASTALSRDLNFTFPTFNPLLAPGPLVFNGLERLEAIEAQAFANVDPDANAARPGDAFLKSVSGRARIVAGHGYPLQKTDDHPLQCQRVTVPDQVPQVTQCVGEVLVGPDGLTVLLHEEIRREGPGFVELTVNAVHVVRERAEQRTEIILGQAYAAASYVGDAPFIGPLRDLSLQSDAGSGRDAPAALSTPLVLTQPGVYQGRIHGVNDVDAYATHVVPGQKIQVTLVPSHAAAVTLAPVATPAIAYAQPPPPVPSVPPPPTVTPPSTSTRVVKLSMALHDPDLVSRQESGSLVAEPFAVELNVDEPGLWVWVVSSRGSPGDYTFRLTIVDAPMVRENDAGMRVDAPGTCGDALLVGPGAHLGTIERRGESDFYRFQAFEGQKLALVLRPGDTVEAADFDLYFYGPDCKLLRASTASAPVKGMAETILYDVPPGKSGLYRLEVRQVNGLGTYEIVPGVVPVVVPA